MSFFRRKGRGAAGGRPGTEGRLPPSSPARLLGPGPAPPGTATGPREEARPLRSELPANHGQSRHLPGPFPPSGFGEEVEGGRGCAGTAAAGFRGVGRGLPACGPLASGPGQPPPASGAAPAAAALPFCTAERSLTALKRGRRAVRWAGVKCLAPRAIFEPL